MTTNTITAPEAIVNFIEQWKVEAKRFYTAAHEEYLNIEKQVSSPDGRITGAQNKEYDRLRRAFIEKYGKGTTEIVAYSFYRIDEILEKDAKSRIAKLIAKVEKKAGKIVDARDLYFGSDGTLNGIVVGEKETVRVETILAGGYNIQCLHYRVLVK